jgi:hypothetical protein
MSYGNHYPVPTDVVETESAFARAWMVLVIDRRAERCSSGASASCPISPHTTTVGLCTGVDYDNNPSLRVAWELATCAPFIEGVYAGWWKEWRWLGSGDAFGGGQSLRDCLESFSLHPF